MTIRIAVLVLLALSYAAPPAAAQQAATRDRVAEPTTIHELVLRDGSRLYGTVQRETETEVVFRTHSGTELTAARAEIVTLRLVSGTVVNGEFQRVNANATRLLFGPTGRALEKRQVYLGVYEFILPFVQVGITDRFSVGGGTPLVFGFGDDGWNRPFWITPKLQVFRSDSTSFSVGAFQGFGGGGSAGIAYGVGTFGRPDASLTVGGGVAYADGGDAAGVLMVGGERQVGRSVALISENYVWQGGTGVASAGVRFFGERLSADLALAVPFGDEFFVFPVVNFVYVFNGRR